MIKVAVVSDDYPATQLEPDKLRAVRNSILAAYDDIPEQGPQDRFARCALRPGYLILTCADAESAEWLKEVVPTIRLWEGAALRAPVGKGIPKPFICTALVPAYNGQEYTSERILSRLRTSNKAYGFNTSLWTVWSSNKGDKGTLWTFSADRESVVALREIGLQPYLGFGKLKFKVKEGQPGSGQTGEKAYPQE